MIDSVARASRPSSTADGAPSARGPVVRLATTQDVPHLAGVLARAFADDPYFTYLTARSPDRTERLRAGWAGILRYASVDLAATYTTEERTGVALWVPPGDAPRSRLDALRLLVAMTRLRGLRRMRSVSDGVRHIEARLDQHVPGPHVHLAALAVDVGRQGDGTGTALMRPVLDHCDVTGTPASLETVNRTNLPFYERVGFRVVEELTVPAAGLGCWLMVRRPAAATGAAVNRHPTDEDACPR